MGFSAQLFSPSAPLNLAGNVEIAYYDNPSNVSTVNTLIPGFGPTFLFNAPSAPRSSMTTQLAYKCVPAREKIRVIHNPCADSTKPMISVNQFNKVASTG